jgi:OOP family OmpA-OmpF porin
LPEKNYIPLVKKNFLFVLLTFSILCSAQTSERKTAVAVYAGTIQYNGEIGNQFFRTDHLQAAFSISVAQYLCRSFNLGLMYSIGDVNHTNGHDYLLGTMSSMNLFLHYKFFNGKILGEDARVAPYLIAGFGADEWNESQPVKTRFTDAFIPVGLGFRIRLSNSISILLQSEYHFTMSDDYDNTEVKKGKDYFLHTMAGLSFAIGEGKDSDGDKVKDKKDHCPDTPPGIAVDISGCPLDRDSDGIADYLDECPDTAGNLTGKGCPDKDRDSIIDRNDNCPELAGPAETYGCPDRDLDGVADADDFCPDVKGLPDLHGCPDRDEDLVADNQDECPDEKGLIALQGCPDRDGDGIADKDDRCPDEAGIAANKGCPEIKEEVKKIFEQALTGLQFETGKDIIRKSSYKIMDEVVKVMSDHPEYRLVISGHTDNTGTPEKNLELSQKRAAASAKYLVDHGIDPSRITSAGYGDTMPVADNKTNAGRAKNRRVEFKVVF